MAEQGACVLAAFRMLAGMMDHRREGTLGGKNFGRASMDASQLLAARLSLNLEPTSPVTRPRCGLFPLLIGWFQLLQVPFSSVGTVPGARPLLAPPFQKPGQVSCLR